MSLTAAQYAAALTNPVTNADSWANTSNALGSTSGNYATLHTTDNNSSNALEFTGFNVQSLVPSGAVINSVAATFQHFWNPGGSNGSENGQLYAAAVLKLGTTVITRTSAGADTITATNYSWAELADVRVRYLATNGSGTINTTFSLDYVFVVVDFTPRGGDVVKQIKRRLTTYMLVR